MIWIKVWIHFFLVSFNRPEMKKNVYRFGSQSVCFACFNKLLNFTLFKCSHTKVDVRHAIKKVLLWTNKMKNNVKAGIKQANNYMQIIFFLRCFSCQIWKKKNFLAAFIHYLRYTKWLWLFIFVIVSLFVF